jgi:hypothetical protein
MWTGDEMFIHPLADHLRRLSIRPVAEVFLLCRTDGGHTCQGKTKNGKLPVNRHTGLSTISRAHEEA